MGALALNKATQKGFSLLEVLVAFVIMGLVVGTLLQLYGSAMRSVALADQMSFAVLAAESQMALVGQEIKIEQGEKSGSVENSDYKWKVKIEPAELMEEQDQLGLSSEPFKVTVIIEWQDDRKTRSFELSSIRFGERKS